MATQNIISKSLGDIFLESGNGTPNHTSPKGSLYTNKDTGNLYKNTDGATAWINFNGISHGEVYYVDNTTVTTISSSNTWTAVGNSFIEGDVVAFSAATDTMVLLNGYDGDYNIVANASLDFVAGADNFDVGLSVNGAVPVDGTFNSGNVDATYTTANISITCAAALTGSTTLELAVRNLDGTNNVIIQHGQIFAKLVK